MGSNRSLLCRAGAVLVCMLVGLWAGIAAAQGVMAPPAAAVSAPSPFMGASPLQPPAGLYGSDAVSVNSGMFGDLMPAIPNLEFGYTFSFGSQVRQGRVWGDYVLPINVGARSVVFGEAHGEFENFWKQPRIEVVQPAGFTTTTYSHDNRTDLSFGGGYRTIFANRVMVGGNAFYDSSRLFNRWYSSGGFGLEFAANTFTNAAVDLNVNWYGNFFSRGSFLNAWRNQRGSLDVEAGYSQGLFGNAMDLRLKTVGYSFDVGDRVWGWKVGGDLTTRDGMFAVKYEYGNDRLNGCYQQVSAQVNVGFNLDGILSGRSPFTMPAPVFVNPRNLSRLLGLKVKRNWHQPSAVLAVNQVQNPSPSGSGLSCDRVVAPFPLSFVGVYTALHPFTPFPYGSLTPAGLIHVTVTLANPAPAGLFISVAVIGANNITTNQGFTFATGARPV